MNRRDFLQPAILTKPAAATAPPIAPPNGGLTSYSGAWTVTEVIHLLKRTMFGATLADINYFKSTTMSQAVDELLNPVAPLPDPPVKEYTSTLDPTILPGTTWVNDPSTDGTVNSLRRSSFKKWWMGLMINQDRSVREKMTLFWHNHFST